MPCNTIQRSSVEFNIQNTNAKLLQLAFKALGYSLMDVGATDFSFYKSGTSGSYRNGKVSLTTEQRDFDVNAVKRAYSVEVVKFASQRFGWAAKQTTETRFVVGKRA